MTQNANHKITFSIDEKSLALLDMLASLENRTRSGCIRWLVARETERRYLTMQGTQLRPAPQPEAQG